MSLFDDTPFEGQSGAILSPDGRYRYRLWRSWEPGAKGWTAARPLGIIMLNPSTADHTVDDPTIRRCIHFAQRGHRGIDVVNLWPYRATNPLDLLEADDPEGNPEGDLELNRFFADHEGYPVLAAWGANAAKIDRARRRAGWRGFDRRQIIAERAALNRVRFVCLGTTGDGDPRHPLYIKGDQEFLPYTVDV